MRAPYAYAQVNASQAPHNKYPSLSDEQQHQGHYAVSGLSASKGVKTDDRKVAQPDPSDADKARFNMAVAKLKADAGDAPAYAVKTLSETVNPAYTQRLSYTLAQYYFQKDKYAAAIKYYEEAGVANLDNDEVGDQKFELAYCYFNNKQLDKAKPLFAYIKDLKGTKYYMAGNYYYGLLCYNENKYDEALRSFDIIKDEKEYRAYVPYYIAEIYYFKGNRARALSLTDTLISSKEKSFYHNELHLLAAQCLFEEQEYARARPYFEYYYEHTKKIGKEDLYKMAYCYYRLGEWKNATEKFKMLSNAHDSLGQTSMYLLGDCYLKTGNRVSARNAFGLCADMPYNKPQQEAAMILYARLSYENGNNDEALRMTNTLLTNFPNSKFTDEAKTLRSDLLIKTSQYEDALRLLQDVQAKDEHYNMVYQKTTYGYAVQQFRKGEAAVADEYFAKSLSTPVIPEYERAAYFWRGELAYHDKRYSDAITYSQNFISRIGDIRIVEKISPQATVQHAYLNMGYSALEMGNYVAAQDYFAQARLAASGDTKFVAATNVLEADAVFLQKNYTKALGLYEKIIASGSTDAEYAQFQKGIILGLLNRNQEKLALLQQIARSKPPSTYAANARYEIAVTQMDMESYKPAISSFRYLIDSAADKSFVARSLMKTGFAYQQLNDNANAIAAYRRVVTEHPGAEERFAALEALKNLYVQSNQPGKYAELLNESDLPSGDSGAVESAYYAAGESQFIAGKWEEARRAYTDYLKHYPNGINAIKAHYYLGESNYRLKKFAEAREHFNAVLATPWNDFSESSARRAAVIAMELKDAESAYKTYLLLRTNSAENSQSEAIYRGLMKSAYHSGRHTEANAYSDTLTASPTTSADGLAEAKLYKARCLQVTDKAAEALEIYKQLATGKTGEIAAEARYHIALTLKQQGKLKEAEDAANESIRLSSGYETWVTGSYLLLADILIEEKDLFNAKALLQSIVKNTKNAELKKEATRKLDEVKKMEKQQSKLED
ncbi:tetratricopeptide repeat protein [Nemorincola caseinilytica]|uniref:Tetratricopeptide repeat protein n=1 Tax=Nemorincola caseinilytica TaxID=2054315 RepID=A0ABP8NPI6_9BACT